VLVIDENDGLDPLSEEGVEAIVVRTRS